MTTMPAQYFNRFDETKEYDEHLFIAGRGLQSAELNEIQARASSRLKDVADALFKDGDIVRDAVAIVDGATGAVTCGSGAVYIRGAVRGVSPAAFTIPIIGTFAIGVHLIESVITSLEDPALLDPATGTRNYNEPGAERLKVHTQWGWENDGVTGQFFPVYSVVDGFLLSKEPPPNLDPIIQSLARYDRDSAGGTYVVSGLTLSAMPDVGDVQTYSLQEGRARVYGYGIEFTSSRRVSRPSNPDLKIISNEPHLSSTDGAQRINFDRSPGTNITQVSITAEKTVTLTHGVFTGAQDTLPDTSVLSIIEVKQGATTYTPTTDYLLTAGKVNWTPAGAEPSPGSTYTVKYRYITLVTPTAIDDLGFTVTGAVPGTLVMVSYSHKLPRLDKLCLSTTGEPIWLSGVASYENPQPPMVPNDLLAVASVYQDWTANRRVLNDGVRAVPMPKLAAVESRMDLLAQLIAQQRLESDIHTRESGTKLGLFTDPFIDNSQRDAGTTQNAAVVRGELVLPIASTVSQLSADVTVPTTCTYTNIVALEQALRTTGMNINPYMAFGIVPARVTLTPAVDRWTTVQTTWTGPETERFSVGGGGVVVGPPSGWWSESSSTRDVLLNTTTSAAETLRPITVQYSIEGFGPGELLAALFFDGVHMTQPVIAANSLGVLVGSFVIPANIPSGNKLISVVGAGGSYGEATFSGQGTIERQTWQQRTTVTSTWQSPPAPDPAPIVGLPGEVVVGPINGVMNPFGLTGIPFLDAWLIGTPGDNGGGGGGDGNDPLAQTFVPRISMHMSAIDLWFTVVPTTTTRIQIRETTTGLPNSVIVAEAVVPLSSILLGGASTRILFSSPVLLLGTIEYAIVVMCDDANGAVSVAELGKFDVNAQQWITSQPYTVGVLLSSSNNRTWTPHQDRDLAFRVLQANYTATTRSVPLGNVAVVGATDLMLMSFAQRPDSATDVEYTLTLPDASVVSVSDAQPVQLPAAITGNVTVAATLTGTAFFSPVLMPGTQLAAGTLAPTGTYVSRAIPAGLTAVAKVIYEAVIPSGATVQVSYKGPDIGDTWSAPVAVASTRSVDDGFVEFIHTTAAVNELSVQIRLILNGTTVARPRVRDLRVIVT